MNEYWNGFIDCIGFTITAIMVIAIIVLIIQAIKDKLKKKKKDMTQKNFRISLKFAKSLNSWISQELKSCDQQRM